MGGKKANDKEMEKAQDRAEGEERIGKQKKGKERKGEGKGEGECDLER
jgi:hypothetical protein